VEELAGRVAVVTGGASGIGLAMAERFARLGMRVVIADVEAGALEAAAADLSADGAEVIGVQTDVSDRASVEALAAATIERFGAPQVLCNNAGVAGSSPGPVWDTPETEWSWVLGVNLMGVVHGLQAFIPAMIASGQPGHVVNTSSIFGLMTEGSPVYGVTKHAVTRLSEGLWYNLRDAGAPIGVSVLCPGMIATNILRSVRNRPVDLGGNEMPPGDVIAQMHGYFQEHGMQPAEVAAIVEEAIRSDRFYVLTDEGLLSHVERRFRGIFDGTPPPPNVAPIELAGPLRADRG
jgi:NAD(P)-dependent dehydrogenase (short-subunit alcohol dehydrogenase family)